MQSMEAHNSDGYMNHCEGVAVSGSIKLSMHKAVVPSSLPYACDRRFMKAMLKTKFVS